MMKGRRREEEKKKRRSAVDRRVEKLGKSGEATIEAGAGSKINGRKETRGRRVSGCN
jgi:hypothetical protein